MKIKEITEGFDAMAERKKPSRAKCLSPGKLSAFDSAHCVNMGYKARKTHHHYNVNGKSVDVYGKKIKGAGAGGPIPDYSRASRARGSKK
jgi:hypothetical protein